MKKRTVLLSALLLSSGLVSCDFLDIDTPGIVNKDKMFENEQGFIDAMNGVYASLAVRKSMPSGRGATTSSPR